MRQNAILLKIVLLGPSFLALNQERYTYIALYKSHSRRDAKRYLRFHLSSLSDIIRPECIHRVLLYGSIFARQQ